MIGIALVVEDASQGVRLAFRYPASLRSSGLIAQSKRGGASLKTNFPGATKSKKDIDNNPYEFNSVEDEYRDASESSSSNYNSANNNGDDFKTGFFDLEPDFFAQLFRPKNSLCNKPFELEIDQVTFISHPVLCGGNSLNFFNVVFAVPSDTDRTSGEEAAGTSAPGSLSRPSSSRAHLVGYRLAASRLAHALFYEESRCNYVSNEASKILNVWEQLEKKPHDQTGTINGSGGTADSEKNSDPQTLIDVCLSRSLLACELKDVYHKLNEKGSAHFSLNLWMPLSIALRDPICHPAIPIRPYQTLMLLDEEASVLASLPRDASPQLQSFVKMTNVMKSFLELHVDSGVSLTQLFRLAAHLVFWGKGKIIDTLTKNNVYVVHPKADLRPNSTNALEFYHKFSPMTLHQALNHISSRLTNIGEHMRGMSSEKQLRFIHVLIWLLRKDFLSQIHTYIHLLIGDAQQSRAKRILSSSKKTVKNNRRGKKGNKSRQGGNISSLNDYSAKVREDIVTSSGVGVSPPIGVSVGGGGPSGWLDIASQQQKSLHLQPHERSYLEQIANDTPVYKLFKRLCPYLHGKHHIEEIMWRETVSRKAIMSVLANYGDVLVTVQQRQDDDRPS